MLPGNAGAGSGGQPIVPRGQEAASTAPQNAPMAGGVAEASRHHGHHGDEGNEHGTAKPQGGGCGGGEFDPFKHPRGAGGRFIDVGPKVGDLPGLGAGLAEKEKEAVGAYTGAGYRAINGALRAGKTADAAVVDQIAILDGMMGRAALPEAMMLYRAAGTLDAKRILAQSLEKGGTLPDPGFGSTSASLAVAKSDLTKRFGAQSSSSIILEIKAPKGAKALDISSISDAGKGEQEFLIARGTQYKVIKYKSKARRLSLELLK